MSETHTFLDFSIPKLRHITTCHKFEMYVKFMFSKKATKFDKIFTVDLTLCSNCQIDGEDFFQFLWPS